MTRNEGLACLVRARTVVIALPAHHRILPSALRGGVRVRDEQSINIDNKQVQSMVLHARAIRPRWYSIRVFRAWHTLSKPKSWI